MDGFLKDGGTKAGFYRIFGYQVHPASIQVFQKKLEVHIGIELLRFKLHHKIKIAIQPRLSLGIKPESIAPYQTWGGMVLPSFLPTSNINRQEFNMDGQDSQDKSVKPCSILTILTIHVNKRFIK